MDMKYLLDLILIVVLQFEAGISVERSYHYSRPGEDAILSCANPSPSDPPCSTIKWFNDRNRSEFIEVGKGNAGQDSRLRVDTSCSLVINNVTAEDVGFYFCRQGRDSPQDVSVYLSVLTVSPSPPDTNPKRDGEVTLECSLVRHIDLFIHPCPLDSIRWLDEAGNELHGDGVGYSVLGQKECVSVLSVKRQQGHNRKYTCQFIDNNNHKTIEAEYTPDFTDGTTETSNPDSPVDHTYIIIISAVAGAVMVLAVIAALLLIYRTRVKGTDDVQNVQNPTQHPDDPESNLTYVTVSHANQQATPYKKVKEEEVTYSTVNTVAMTEAANDLQQNQQTRITQRK